MSQSVINLHSICSILIPNPTVAYSLGLGVNVPYLAIEVISNTNYFNYTIIDCSGTINHLHHMELANG